MLAASLILWFTMVVIPGHRHIHLQPPHHIGGPHVVR